MTSPIAHLLLAVKGNCQHRPPGGALPIFAAGLCLPMPVLSSPEQQMRCRVPLPQQACVRPLDTLLASSQMGRNLRQCTFLLQLGRAN